MATILWVFATLLIKRSGWAASAIPIGFIVGFWLLFSLPEFPPAGSYNWWFYIALFWSVIGLFSVQELARKTTAAGFAIVGLIGFILLQGPMISRYWTDQQTSIYALSVFAYLLTLFYLSQAWLQPRLQEAGFLLAYVILLTALSLACAFGGSILLAQMIGIGCASVGAFLILRLMLSNLQPFVSQRFFVIAFLFLNLTYAYFMVDVTLYSVISLAIGGTLVALLQSISVSSNWLSNSFHSSRVVVQMSSYGLLALLFSAYPVYKALMNFQSGGY